MKGKKGWKQRACLCLMVFLIGLSGLAGASSRDDIYREELDILYAMVQSGSSYILFGEERDDLMAVWEGVRDLSSEQGLEAVKYQLLDCNGDGKPELLIGQDNRLTNLFTIRDGQLHQVFSGFYRNAWYYLGNGRFLNQGSGDYHTGRIPSGQRREPGVRKLLFYPLGSGYGKRGSLLEYCGSPGPGPVEETGHESGSVPGTPEKTEGQG